MKFVDQPQFYLELTWLGQTTEEYLYRLNHVNGVFQESKAACLRIAEDIMIFVNNADKVGQAGAGDLGGMRGCLGRKLARLKGSWENLSREALKYNETVIFTELEELVEIAETATVT